MTMRFSSTVASLSALALPTLFGCQQAGLRGRAYADVSAVVGDAGEPSLAQGGPAAGGSASEVDADHGEPSTTTPVRGDVDGDGIEDLVRFRKFTGQPELRLRPLSGAADWPEWRLAIIRGRTGVEGIYETASAPGSVPRAQVADLNCDGVPEILAYTSSVPSPNVRSTCRSAGGRMVRSGGVQEDRIGREARRVIPRSVNPRRGGPVGSLRNDAGAAARRMPSGPMTTRGVGDPSLSGVAIRLDTASGAIVPTRSVPA